jgi:hypothetical protein
MKPHLCKAGETLRDQVNARYPSRDKTSDGWIADARHYSEGHSDHIPSVLADAVVRAIDIDRDLSGRPKPDLMPYLADQIRLAARSDKRIAYVIFNSKICSKKSLWRWVAYRGVNPHIKHCHISFTKKGDADGSFFNIPMIGGTA